MEKMVYQIKEVERITDLSRNTVNKLIKSGQLKAIKAGERRWLIPAWALNEFLSRTEG